MTKGVIYDCNVFIIQTIDSILGQRKNTILCLFHKMRTTFGEMRLFNDASQKHDTSCILNGKEWGVGKTEREREREREKEKE